MNQAAFFDSSTTIERSRPISIDYGAIAEIAQPDAEGERRLILNVFPGRAMSVLFQAPVFHHPNAYTQVGIIDHEPLSEVILSVNGSSIAMNIRSEKGTFYIRNNGEYHTVYQTDEELPAARIVEHEVLISTDAGETPLASGPQIDVMVIYSTAAKNAGGGSVNLLNLVYLAAAEVNQGFLNSNINAYISIVHTQEVSTEPTSYPSGLYCITEMADGCLDTIHATRDQHYADIVLYIVDNNTYCGLSWMITNFTEYSPSHAFALVNWRCAASRYAMAREIGHILGAQTDRESAGYDQGAFPYAYGYQAPNGAFRTIMASECASGTCSRINYWSNPDIRINDIPLGVNYLLPNAADNRRAINTTAQWVSDFRIPPSPPDQVTILTPENGSVHSVPPVVYAWLPEPDASDYQMLIKQRDTNAILADFILNAEAHCTDVLCSYSPDITMPPDDYKWHVAGINSIGIGSFSAYNNFYLQLQPPVLTLPANQAIVYDHTPLLGWNRLTNSPTYLVQLLTEAGTIVFSTEVTDAVNCQDPQCSYTPLENLPDGDYKWHVRGKKTVYGLWSPYARFSIQTLPPPQLSSPEHQQIVYTPSPLFSFLPVPDAENYELELSDLDRGTTTFQEILPEVHCSDTSCSYRFPTPLEYGQYSWKVRGFADEAPGIWSPSNAFTLNRLPAPDLASPADQTDHINEQPVFFWYPIAPAETASYEIQIRNNTTNAVVFSDRLLASACLPDTCRFTLPDILPDGDYKWHVRAWSTEDYGIWSVYWRFSVTTPPPAPRLRSPGNNATIYGARPTFKWFPLENVTSYRLQLNAAGGSAIGSWQIGLASCQDTLYCEFRIPHPLPGFGTYTWNVRAIRNGTEGDWSTTYTYTYQQLARTTLISPANQAVFTSDTLAFAWNTVAGPTYYQFQIRDLDDNIIVFELVPAAACTGTCIYQPSIALPDGDYKWHARAKNGINYAPWTPYWEFTVDAHTTLSFDFDGAAPGWEDPADRWTFFNDVYYRGSPGSQPFFSAITYLDQSFTDAVLRTQLRSVGVNGPDGFSFVLRATFSSSGAIIRGYTIDVEGTTSGVNISGWRVSTSSSVNTPSIDLPLAVTIPGIDLSVFHVYELRLLNNQATLFIDGDAVYDMQIDPLYDSGMLGFDVISTHTTGHSVDINWVEIEYQ
ncbi:MAG: hypothetical protein HPY85_03520 [Anaerolineae bacterium]|nr:hypothetical protein [Anaerolineae bacterium]